MLGDISSTGTRLFSQRPALRLEDTQKPSRVPMPTAQPFSSPPAPTVQENPRQAPQL